MRSAAGAAQTARQQSYDCHVALRNFRTHADSAQPRNPTLNTRPSFRAGAREGLGTRLAEPMPGRYAYGTVRYGAIGGVTIAPERMRKTRLNFVFAETRVIQL